MMPGFTRLSPTTREAPTITPPIRNQCTVTVGKTAASIAVTPYHVTYDANPHSATGTATGLGGVDLSAGLTLSGTTHSNAGDYPSDAWSFTGGTNYNDAGGTVHDIIDKATASITVNGFTGVYDAVAHGATSSVLGVDTAGAAQGTNLNLGASFTHVPGGTAHWTFNGGTNYTDQSGDAAIVITKANATVAVIGYTGVYDAAPHGATGSEGGIGGENAGTLNLGGSFTHVPGRNAPLDLHRQWRTTSTRAATQPSSSSRPTPLSESSATPASTTPRPGMAYALRRPASAVRTLAH